MEYESSLPKNKVKRVYSYSTAWTSQFYFCSLPLRLDSYKSCNFGCKYCFVSHRGGSFRKDCLATADIVAFGKCLNDSCKPTTEDTGLIPECIKHRLPIHFGGMSEPFRHGELDDKITYMLLSILAETGYPTVVSTKSRLPAIEPYFTLLRSMKYVAIQFSFSTLDDDIASKIEPYAPLPSSRLRAMHKLSQAGLWVGCRLQPFIPNISGSISALVEKLAGVGVRHITVEHLKLGLYERRKILTELQQHKGKASIDNYNLSKLKLKGTEYELLSKYKFDTLKSFREETKKHNVTLGIGDNDFHDLGDSPNCCGVGKLPGFENYFRRQITYAIWKRRKDGLINYSLIGNEWAPKHSIRRYINSRCRNKGSPNPPCYTSDDYLRREWNNPNGLHSPTECANVVLAGFQDDAGNLVYRYEPIYKFE